MAKSVVINGTTYPDIPYIQSPLSGGGGNATFYDTSDATATNANVLDGATFYKDGGKSTGSMTNNGATGGTISTKAGTVSIPSGYTSGGTVSISSTEQNKIIASNIKSGVTILGQAGSSTVVDTAISTDAAAQGTVLNGKKCYVNGTLVTGNMTTPTVTQDATTKVLTIS